MANFSIKAHRQEKLCLYVPYYCYYFIVSG